MYRATFATQLIPDTDSSPLDYLPRDYSPDLVENGGDYHPQQVLAWETDDYAHIEAWRRDDWRFWGVVVTATIHTTVNGKDFTTEEENSLWSVDDVDPTYPETVAAELRDELTTQLREDYPGIEITHV